MDEWITQAETATMLGWQPSRVCQAVRRGQLGSAARYDVRRGRIRRLVARADVERLKARGRLPGYQPRHK